MKHAISCSSFDETLTPFAAVKRNRIVTKKHTTSLVFGIAGWLAVAVLALTGCSSFTADSYNAEGVRMLSASRTDDALDCFAQAQNADPGNADAFYNSGVVFHQIAIETGQQADFEQAKYYYDECLARNPNHVECNRSKATLLCDMGRPEAAFQQLQSWVNREPASPEPRIELARLYDEHNQLDKARDLLNDAIAIDNRNVRAYTALGSVRERMGNSADALRAYEQALALNPYQPEVNSRVAALRYSSPATTPPSAPLRPGQQNAIDPNGAEAVATQPGTNTTK